MQPVVLFLLLRDPQLVSSNEKRLSDRQVCRLDLDKDGRTRRLKRLDVVTVTVTPLLGRPEDSGRQVRPLSGLEPLSFVPDHECLAESPKSPVQSISLWIRDLAFEQFSGRFSNQGLANSHSRRTDDHIVRSLNRPNRVGRHSGRHPINRWQNPRQSLFEDISQELLIVSPRLISVDRRQPHLGQDSTDILMLELDRTAAAVLQQAY